MRRRECGVHAGDMRQRKKRGKKGKRRDETWQPRGEPPCSQRFECPAGKVRLLGKG